MWKIGSRQSKAFSGPYIVSQTTRKRAPEELRRKTGEQKRKRSEDDPMLHVCCFCDNVCDDATAPARREDFRVYMRSRKLNREDTVLSYTCCAECLLDDPQATAFRTRQRRSGFMRLEPQATIETLGRQ
jgi:hypothetical protein